MRTGSCVAVAATLCCVGCSAGIEPDSSQFVQVREVNDLRQPVTMTSCWDTGCRDTSNGSSDSLSPSGEATSNLWATGKPAVHAIEVISRASGSRLGCIIVRLTSAERMTTVRASQARACEGP
jgi:hypothetical protein